MKSDETMDEVRGLLPFRDLPPEERRRLGIIRQGQSRPRKIAPAPSPDGYLEQLAELRTEAAAADPVVVAAGANATRDFAVFDEVLRQIAVESAAIKFLRIEAERRGVEVGSLCSRRIDGLVRIGSLVGERLRHEPDRVDVRAEKFQKVVGYFMALLHEAAAETLSPQEGERFFARYAELSANWEDRVDPPPRGQSD